MPDTSMRMDFDRWLGGLGFGVLKHEAGAYLREMRNRSSSRLLNGYEDPLTFGEYAQALLQAPVYRSLFARSDAGGRTLHNVRYRPIRAYTHLIAAGNKEECRTSTRARFFFEIEDALQIMLEKKSVSERCGYFVLACIYAEGGLEIGVLMEELGYSMTLKGYFIERKLGPLKRLGLVEEVGSGKHRSVKPTKAAERAFECMEAKWEEMRSFKYRALPWFYPMEKRNGSYEAGQPTSTYLGILPS